MEYRQLGRSGLRVSTVALGTMTFGGTGKFHQVGGTGVDEARELLAMSIDAGVNLIDTADMYSAGRSEEVLGEALGHRRDEVLLASKARAVVGHGPNDGGSSRFHLIRSVEASLRRLRTDHLDLYQLHGWDGETPLEETTETLDTLIRSGKVRYVGASNFAGWQLMKALAVADSHGHTRFVSHQAHYSLQSRDAEHELVPVGLDQGVGLLAWSPLSGGLLSGKYRRHQQPPPDGRLASDWQGPPVDDAETLYDIIDALTDIAQQHQATEAQIALAWLRERPGVTSVIVGARHQAQLRANLQASDVSITPQERRRLDDLSATPPPYPYWHQYRHAADRLSAADQAHLAIPSPD